MCHFWLVPLPLLPLRLPTTVCSPQSSQESPWNVEHFTSCSRSAKDFPSNSFSPQPASSIAFCDPVAFVLSLIPHSNHTGHLTVLWTHKTHSYLRVLHLNPPPVIPALITLNSVRSTHPKVTSSWSFCLESPSNHFIPLPSILFLVSTTTWNIHLEFSCGAAGEGSSVVTAVTLATAVPRGASLAQELHRMWVCPHPPNKEWQGGLTSKHVRTETSLKQLRYVWLRKTKQIA